MEVLHQPRSKGGNGKDMMTKPSGSKCCFVLHTYDASLLVLLLHFYILSILLATLLVVDGLYECNMNDPYYATGLKHASFL